MNNARKQFPKWSWISRLYLLIIGLLILFWTIYSLYISIVALYRLSPPGYFEFFKEEFFDTMQTPTIYYISFITQMWIIPIESGIVGLICVIFHRNFFKGTIVVKAGIADLFFMIANTVFVLYYTSTINYSYRSYLITASIIICGLLNKRVARLSQEAQEDKSAGRTRDGTHRLE